MSVFPCNFGNMLGLLTISISSLTLFLALNLFLYYERKEGQRRFQSVRNHLDFWTLKIFALLTKTFKKTCLLLFFKKIKSEIYKATAIFLKFISVNLSKFSAILKHSAKKIEGKQEVSNYLQKIGDEKKNINIPKELENEKDKF